MEERLKEFLNDMDKHISHALEGLEHPDRFNVKNQLIKSRDVLDSFKRYNKFIDSVNELPEDLNDLKKKYEEVYNKFYNINDIDLWSKEKGSREVELVYLRDFFMKIAHRHYKISDHALGRLVKRDRSLVIHSRKKKVIGCPTYNNIKQVLIQNKLYY